MAKTGRMLAIALDEKYNNLRNVSFEVRAFVNNAVNSTYTEGTTTYEIYFWNEWSTDDKVYEDILAYLSTVRHSFIVVNDAIANGSISSIVVNNKDTDENGTDELFNSMLSLNFYCKFFDMEYGTEDPI